ncbi:MAG: DUF1538 domain-containing protein [Clostridia bacterium]|jgi:hypothetical protein|nr:DUF1538 domain-containing protein [Clostridia bacterium]
MIKALLLKLKESFISVLPIAVIVLILSFTPLAPLNATERITFAICAVLLILGIGLFNLGADLAMTPMGGHVGTGLTKSKKVVVLISVCFVMGVLITVAEPDLSVLASQVSEVMNNMVLIITVGVGVGIFLILSILKIVFHKSLSMLLMFFYMMLFAICAILIECGKNDFLSISFDSGGVTTGPITVPFIMALGFGIATTVGGRDANENSFGLIALCSIGPIIAVMILALCSKGEISQDTLNALASYDTVEESLKSIGHALLRNVKNVGVALALIVAFFLILQFTVLKLPRQKLAQIGIGIAYTFVGLVIFLVAVEVGFMPIGYKLGTEIASYSKAILAVFGFVIGFVVVLAEPAVHVLNKQVEQVTGGGVKKIEMMLALSIAVGISLCLSIIRIIFHFSLLYYLIPGYLISLGLSFFVPRIYTAIAFDSGGVASGPLTSSFILPLIVGSCVAVNGGPDSILTDAFGVVAMVAMTPLITIQALGFKAIMSAKVRNKIAMKRILSADDEQIIYFK